MASLSLTVMINKEKTKVLFAEASSDFINVLLSFLTLPLGKIVTILQKHEGSELGSLTTLYKGLSELDTAHFSVPGAKEMLLNPRSSFQPEYRQLPIDVTDTAPLLQYFLCEDVNCSQPSYDNISMYSDIAVCDCGGSLTRRIGIKDECRDGGEAFVVSPLFFIVTDDLRVVPIVSGIVQALSDLGITDTRGAEMKSLSLGPYEIGELLKLSLTSATPLTDMVMKSNNKCPQSEVWLDHIHQHDAPTESNKIVIRAFLHESTNKFLFAEASDEFVELLSSFLAIPLGGVEFLLAGNTPFKNIDNLYRSVSNGIDDKHFTTSDTKNRLVSPKLAHGYLPKNQFLPLSEEGPPKLFYQATRKGLRYNYSSHEKEVTIDMVSSFKSSKEVYIKKQTMCFVSDDLTMSPSLTSRISILNDGGIPLSEMKETEFHIGLNEALCILKASLTSKTALTDGLIKPLLKRQPKKERC
ncbi:uncharacterized protein LOC125188130 [Salvia hispanica]|uniref:uncharacterized protein LOC125188130 n=1 Tax=Salvia hispanica TaxID=49212 RepID=UPI002009C59E|nr:uncharacterized protein LOC125188130 [Salvia hispanica]